MRSVLGVHWKDWCWIWNFNTLATSCEELTHWKRPWCWEGFRAGGEGDNRGWDGWMASLTRWTWVSVNSGSWWWTGRSGVLWFIGSQRVGHNWATELTSWCMFDHHLSFSQKSSELHLISIWNDESQHPRPTCLQHSLGHSLPETSLVISSECPGFSYLASLVLFGRSRLESDLVPRPGNSNSALGPLL